MKYAKPLRLSILAASTLLLTACPFDDKKKEEDKPPVVSAGAVVTLKEGRTGTLAGTASDDRAGLSVRWTQESGPTVTIASPTSASTSITAPALTADATASFKLTATDSAGQSASSTVTVTLKNNTPPSIASTTTSAEEKSAVSVTAAPTDDGSMTHFAWTQVSGPTVSFSVVDNTTIRFTAPSVTAATDLVFSLAVTDDDNETSTGQLTVTVNQKLASYTISGKVIGSAFAEADVVADVDGKSFTTVANADGEYQLNVQVDDDRLKTVGVVRATAKSRADASFRAMINGFEKLTPVPASAKSSLISRWLDNAKSAAPNTLDVSAVSTALYSLLVEQNGGTVPADIDTLSYVEKSIDPDLLIEAAAVVQILIDNPSFTLPAGVTNVVELLANSSAYNQMVSNIENASPGLITSTTDAIVNDPTLTPPLDANQIPSSYIRTYAAAPGFLSRGGQRYQFNADGTGNYTYAGGRSEVTWSIVDGQLQVAFAQSANTFSYPAPQVGIAGLTQADVDWLLNNGVNQVEVTYSINSQNMKRLTDGSVIDTFRMTTNQTATMTPRTVNGQTIAPTPVTFDSTADILMRDGTTLSNISFTVADLVDTDWALNRYQTLAWSNGSSRTGFYLDVLSFGDNGIGTALTQGDTFTWSVQDNELVVVFADNSQMTYRAIDEDNDDFSILAIALGGSGNPIAANVDYGIEVAENTGFAFNGLPTTTGYDPTTADGEYWQTMINQWTLSNWNNGKLYFCASNDCNAGNNFFGWEFSADGLDYFVSYAAGFPPNFAPTYGPEYQVTLDISADSYHTLLMNYSASSPIWSCYNGGECAYREWAFLKTKPGLLGERLYVYESVQAKLFFDTNSNDHAFNIGPRLNMYERINYDYWNTDSADVSNGKSGGFMKSSKAPVAKRVLVPTPMPSISQ